MKSLRILEDNTVIPDKRAVKTFMTAAVTKPDKHTRTFQSFVQLIFKGWGSCRDSVQLIWEIPTGKVTESGWSELNWGWGCGLGLQVHALEWGQMVWSLLRGMFSQTSWLWWLTFGAWVTHRCYSLNPETITESHTTPAADTLSLPEVQQCTDDTLSLSVCLSLAWVRPSILGGELISIYQPITRVCKQYEWERWQMALQLLHICSVADQHISFTVFVVWQAVLCCIMLFVFVRGN